MKQQGIKGIPTIPRKLTPCDACILGKHSSKNLFITLLLELRGS
jgi:hypothetical protein